MEPPLPEGWSLASIRQALQCPSAQFMPTTVPVRVDANYSGPAVSASRLVVPEVIIRADGNALVKLVDEDDWYVGRIRNGEVILALPEFAVWRASEAGSSADELPPGERALAVTGRPQMLAWSAAVASWTLLWALILRAEGPAAPGVGRHLLVYVGIVGVMCVAAGARQRGRPWRLTLQYTIAFAISAGIVLVLLIGPDTGAPGACTQGDPCDMEQGIGLVTGPLMFAIPTFALMAISRFVSSAWARLTSRTGQPSTG